MILLDGYSLSQVNAAKEFDMAARHRGSLAGAQGVVMLS